MRFFMNYLLVLAAGGSLILANDLLTSNEIGGYLIVRIIAIVFGIACVAAHLSENR